MIATILMCFYHITRASEAFSAVTARQPMDFTMVYQYPLMHKDGSVVQLKLIKFNKGNCTTIDGETDCVEGFTSHESNFKRKFDSEHPVDTTETVNLTFKLKNKIPQISEEDVLHELYHVVNIHYMSRPVCESNWRYSECLEAQAYGYTHLVNQVRELQKQKRIKLI